MSLCPEDCRLSADDTLGCGLNNFTIRSFSNTKASFPRINTHLNPRQRPRLRFFHMWPDGMTKAHDGRKTTQVSCRMQKILPCTARFLPAFSRIARRILKPATLFLEAAPLVSLSYAALSAFRHSHSSLGHASDVGAMIRFWVEAVSALPYTDDVGERVVDTLLQMASHSRLQPHIPVAAWNWLKKRPVLDRSCDGLRWGTIPGVFQPIRDLGDVELIASYLFTVWSEWTWFYPESCAAMLGFIRNELRGIEGIPYHADLIQRLDYVLSQLSGKPASPEAAVHMPWYRDFRGALVEVNEEAMEMLTRSLPRAVAHLCLLTSAHTYRIPLHLYVCASPPVLVMAHGLSDASFICEPLRVFILSTCPPLPDYRSDLSYRRCGSGRELTD